jgi:predicted negative regulator of RcsB-dependent stress response
MTEYLSEKEQIQLLKNWWKEYGPTIIATIVLFLALSTGWRYWQQHAIKQKVTASTIYSQLIETHTQKKSAETKAFAENLIKNFSRTPYASFAAMLLAKDAVAENKLDDAHKQLTWVIENSKQEDLRELARLRAARILIAENKPQEAITLLQHGKKSMYAAAKQEIIGDAIAAQQKPDAIAHYRKALDETSKDVTTPAISPLLKMKGGL